jgi:hypothetical protein
LRQYLVYSDALTPHLIDSFELAFRCLLANERGIHHYQDQYVSRISPRDGVKALNQRFSEHKLGF